MKNYIGYYILGADSYENALKEKGLLIWLTKKPNAIRRTFNQILLGIYWINRSRIVGSKNEPKKPMQNPDQLTSLPKTSHKKD